MLYGYVCVCLVRSIDMMLLKCVMLLVLLAAATTDAKVLNKAKLHQLKKLAISRKANMRNNKNKAMETVDGYPDCMVADSSYIGDGYCDLYAPYNTKDCGWDGGDCCESTCVDGAETCDDSSYFCLDPDSPDCLCESGVIFYDDFSFDDLIDDDSTTDDDDFSFSDDVSVEEWYNSLCDGSEGLVITLSFVLSILSAFFLL